MTISFFQALKRYFCCFHKKQREYVDEYDYGLQNEDDELIVNYRL